MNSMAAGAMTHTIMPIKHWLDAQRKHLSLQQLVLKLSNPGELGHKT